MTTESEHDQLIKPARLYLLPPEAVFEELKKQAQRLRSEWYAYDDKEIEPTLFERNEPLINLGLACFGANREVFKALYEHSLTQRENDPDAIYKHGLHIGCLSNQVVAKVHFLLRFPKELIGPEEMQDIIARGGDRETTALLRNPTLSDDLLEALYLRSGPFSSLPEERWGRLIIISAKNERLRTEEESEDSPDMGHYRIQKAIFRLLEIAPVTPDWLRVLHSFLSDLDFRQVASPENLNGVLSRWAAMPGKTKDGELFEGYHTNIGLKEEFRCLIAALYGRGFSNNKTILFGSANAPDVALRCAFYGKGVLTKKDMEAGYKRDNDVYLLGAIFNERIYRYLDLRNLLEDQIAFSNLQPIYQKNLKLMYGGQQTDGATAPSETTAPPQPMPALTASAKSGTSVTAVLGYVWRVLVNVFYIAVVLYVFDKLQGRSEAIITVAVLGLIYVTIRSIAIWQGMGLANALKIIESDLIRLRELVRDEHVRDRWEAVKADSEVFDRTRNKLLIDGFFLSIVSIICLLVLFSELGR
jgi:hypothetical protein